MRAPNQHNTLGYLIAGGRATRMGGVNKAAILFCREPMGARIIRSLKSQCAQVWVSANRDPETFEHFGAAKVLPDVIEGSVGPLGGLDALAQERLPDGIEWVLTAPCDVPLYPHNLLAFFSEHFAQHEGKLFVVEAESKRHNTIALIHVSLLESVREFVERGDRKVGIWMHAHHAHACEWNEDADVFTNVNDLNELRDLEVMHREGWII